MKQSVRNVIEDVRGATRVTSRVCLLLISLGLAQSAFAQTSPEPSPTPAASTSSPDSTRNEVDPIENSDGKSSKLTFSLYFVNGSVVADLNVRHQWGAVTAWVAAFYDRTGSDKLIRIGGQYDYRKGWLHLVPTAEVATTKAISASLGAELGKGHTTALLAYSRTNLKAFFDLFWDPGDSVTIGVSHKISSYDRIQAFTVFDVRLHTGQQNTHVVYRRKLNRNNGITLDAVFKTGHGDSGEDIRTAGIGTYYDRPRWFWKVYFDPHVNYTAHTMVRTGIGWKF